METFPGGEFLVVMETFAEDGHKLGIFGQKFDADRNKVDSWFIVNTFTEYDQENPKLDTYANGDFVVIWDSDK